MTQNQDIPKIAYSVDQAARALSIGRTKVFELLKAGQLRSIKIGSRTIIPAEGLQAMLAAGPSREIKSNAD